MRALLLAILLIPPALYSAPAPLPRQPARSLTREMLIGKWQMRWGVFTYHVHFQADGQFSSTSSATTGYRGTWTIHNNRLIILESSTPQRIDSYMRHHIHLNPSTLTGYVEGTDVPYALSVFLSRHIETAHE